MKLSILLIISYLGYLFSLKVRYQVPYVDICKIYFTEIFVNVQNTGTV
jgi:hypothetical protein